MDKPQRQCATDLVYLAKQGDREAVGKLCESYRPRIYNLAVDILENPDDAEDVCQDTFLEILSIIDQLQHPECFEAWIDTIARNLSLKMLKNKQRLVSLDGLIEGQP